MIKLYNTPAIKSCRVHENIQLPFLKIRSLNCQYRSIKLLEDYGYAVSQAAGVAANSSYLQKAGARLQPLSPPRQPIPGR
jgi:hypothetical protein